MSEPAVTVPDAAREAIVELVRDAMGWREWDSAEIRQEVDDALAVAAPHIARAAVLADLKRLADEWESAAQWWQTAPPVRETSPWHAPSVAYAIQSTVVTVRQRIAELEARDV